MNVTRWVTLTEFIKYPGRAGITHVGWFIAWIDRTPKALEKQKAFKLLKKERATMNDE